MMECLILGDSIAVGTATVKKDCVSISKGGYNTWQWNREYLDRPAIDMQEYKNVIISLGSNDHSGVNTEKELNKVRSKINAKNVYWIMPAGNLKASNVPIEKIQSIVLKIAVANNDKIIYIKGLSKDGIHPTGIGYKQIVGEIP